MATDKTQIAQLSLAHIRSDSTVEDIDVEQSIEARMSRLYYDVARKQALKAFNWAFARTRQALAAHDMAAPANEWALRYQYPTNCLAPRYIENPAGKTGDTIPFAVEQASDGTLSIVTNLPDAILVYTKDVEIPILFDTDFEVALSFLLAFYLAGAITSKRPLKQDMLTGYRDAMLVGAAHDANQAVDEPPREASWIRDR